MAAYAKVIERGAKLLDERCPGWEKRINLFTLDLEFPCDCILGQVYGKYDIGFDILALPTGADRDRYGFTAYPPTKSGRTYEGLTYAWRHFILKRLAELFSK